MSGVLHQFLTPHIEEGKTELRGYCADILNRLERIQEAMPTVESARRTRRRVFGGPLSEGEPSSFLINLPEGDGWQLASFTVRAPGATLDAALFQGSDTTDPSRCILGLGDPTNRRETLTLSGLDIWVPGGDGLSLRVAGVAAGKQVGYALDLISADPLHR